ncbi:MAG TPA: response regulator [Gemmatimonadaceae bacterium]|nr:response regulator [Gemmatimonadaceae bacterium]
MSGRSTAIGELRHLFRTPVNHIVGYTEMLLEDLPAGDEEHRAPLRTILDAAHDALAHISAVLVPSETPATDALRRLYAELEEPQARIVRAVSSLIAAHDLGDEAAEDLRRILKAAEHLRPATTEPEAEPAAKEAPPDHPARILVVDDIEDNRQLLRRRLEKQGHQVVCAEDGRRALDIVHDQAIDLVLLDIMMPELDGFAVLQRLKSSAATRDIPVIVISALDDVESAVRCIEQGAEDFLSKPFDPVLLKARVGASLGKKRSRDREVAYLRAAETVAGAAAAVESGTYRPGMLAEVSRRDDAVGKLAAVFDAMASSVRQREQQLHERVRALKLDIAKARESAAPGRAAAEAPHTGERIAGRYEVLDTLGRGGMGAVYRVLDTELGEQIALKTLLKERVAGADVIERFKTEIRLARRITHRNVVRTHDLGEWAGGYFLTMELVRGITLRELLDTRGRLGVSSALAIGSQLVAALGAAHAEGVIHRDVKPHNLLLDAEGTLKVMDFGVARLSERGDAKLTEVGLVVGTPAYMPPEQLLGEEVEARADLYSTGVVLFEALAGCLPFAAVSPMALIARLLQDEPPRVSTLNPEVSEPLDDLVAELLAKRPEGRPASAAEVGERLAALM